MAVLVQLRRQQRVSREQESGSRCLSRLAADETKQSIAAVSTRRGTSPPPGSATRSIRTDLVRKGQRQHSPYRTNSKTSWTEGKTWGTGRYLLPTDKLKYRTPTELKGTHSASPTGNRSSPQIPPPRTPRLATTSRSPSTPQLRADGVGHLHGAPSRRQAADRAGDNQKEVAEPNGVSGPPRPTPHGVWGGGDRADSRPSLSPPPARPQPPAPLRSQLTCGRRHAPPSHGPRPRAFLPARRARRASAAPARRPLPSAFGHAQCPSRLLAEPTTEGGAGGGTRGEIGGRAGCYQEDELKIGARRKEQLELKGTEAASPAGRRAASRCAGPPFAVWDAPAVPGEPR